MASAVGAHTRLRNAVLTPGREFANMADVEQLSTERFPGTLVFVYTSPYGDSFVPGVGVLL